jgi:hypothetical protein
MRKRCEGVDKIPEGIVSRPSAQIQARFLAAICILLLSLAFFQLLSGKYWGKAKSILPRELESKRIAIGTRHNQLVGMMSLVALAALFLIIIFLAHTREFWIAMVALGSVEVFALRGLFRYDDQMCEQLVLFARIVISLCMNRAVS